MIEPVELHGFLRSRRSVRRFLAQVVPDEVIERILITAGYSPSAHNRQPWRFCVIKSSEAKQRLANEMSAEFRRDLLNDKVAEEEVDTRIELSRSRITSSPLVIVLCMDKSEMDTYPDERRNEAERMMAIQSTAASGLQLLLGAHAEGLAGVWTCGPLFAPAAITKALDLQPSWEPQAMYFIGYSDGSPRAKSLKPITDLTRTF
jgi:F420 biosynthesis protein FbiB-like protein